nr:immunoglobulin heavy chain junction region [Macaca mulatta]MOW98820.1 immunoglobulin heavy chain junction region [Macaca mulatta]MOW99014.1 immunoglobulin heavy chain junction region [Macaca mulatta]MOW99076.1 immunoglobulin heavy chain junction region [Macaca mulatta]MOW99295.1 immunoglobulin heavy chain junction region [Macaca mulatta]
CARDSGSALSYRYYFDFW